VRQDTTYNNGLLRVGVQIGLELEIVSVYLQHILDAISRIEEYLQGIDEETFDQQYLVQDGVIRQLEIIGEATRPPPRLPGAQQCGKIAMIPP
jgi:hypothetical protein